MSADFALNLIRETGLEKSATISPISISFALGMTLLGARGNTAKEIQAAIAAKDVSSEVIHSHFLNMYNFINYSNNSDSLKMANKIYFAQNLKVLDSYKEGIQKYYDGNFQLTDFRNSEAATKEINEFVAESTNNEIENIISSLDPDAVMVLVNALYFDKKWENKFTACSEKTLFYSSPEVAREITMMENEGDYNYVVKETYQFLEIPYVDHIFSMFIVLPNERFGLSKLLKTFDVNDFLDSMFTSNCVEGTIKIPKFNAESSFELKQVLKKLKIKDAFDGEKADFSGTTDDIHIYISRVLHKVTVKVSEEGTKAAAATLVEDIPMCYSEPFNFIADHPFLYVIADKGKNIYFIGTFFN